MKRHVSGRPRGVAPTVDARVIRKLQIYVWHHGHRRAGLPQRQNTPYLARFSFRKSIASSAVLPLSHKSRAFVGTLVRFVGKRRCRRPRRRFFAGKPSKCAVRRRRPRQSVEGFSTRHSRALDETSCFRATTWGRPYGGRTGHPQITNICLASRTS